MLTILMGERQIYIHVFGERGAGKTPAQGIIGEQARGV
jgi:hypothetical protein